MEIFETIEKVVSIVTFQNYDATTLNEFRYLYTNDANKMFISI